MEDIALSTEETQELEQLANQILGKNIRLSHLFTGQQYVEAAEVDGDMVYATLRSGNSQTAHYLSLKDLREAAASVAQPKVAATGEDIFLIVEGERIRLAYSFDPYLAVSLSGIQPLPHQLEAVYEKMLPQPRLRFLLADDPGAGKTIMTGLLLKELKLRGALDRVLIVAPAPLTVQWHDELMDKFDEDSFIISGHAVAMSNAWERYDTCIISIDLAKAEDVRDRLTALRWDMVVIDEAHKCSATKSGDDIDKTHRYVLAEKLGEVTDRLLLLTATPHQGNVEQFNLFLQLLDPEIFADQERARKLLTGNSSWFLRRTKENMRDMKGKRLFTGREVMTQKFYLAPAELDLYREVNRYINEFLAYPQEGRKRASITLVRTVLQRRLASSLRAITSSLRRRRDRISDAADKLAKMPATDRQKYVEKQGLNRVESLDDEQLEGGDETEQEDEAALGVVVEARIERLRAEVEELERLIGVAERTAAAGQEAKLTKLLELLSGDIFAEMRQRDGEGKPIHPGSLLIFTEHYDTLTYLRENLEAQGYTCCVIHGGMSGDERRKAQTEFQWQKQICIATEAAGEGINLQFCHLMINYDIPWNPNRLEQRMGRIHRINQLRTVSVFNFASFNTVEGKILARLLEKLDQIRRDMGSDRVFDVVGMMLELGDVRLEKVLSEAVSEDDPKAQELFRQIEQLSIERVSQLERATGVALARSSVDLAVVGRREQDSEEVRVMPFYVSEYFKRASKQLNIGYKERVTDQTISIDRVPAYLTDPGLQAHRRGGTLRRTNYPKTSYTHLTFDKELVSSNKYPDAELLTPDHPLYAAMLDALGERLADRTAQAAHFYDLTAAEPYTLHFFRIDVVGENGRGEPQVVYSTVRAVREMADGFVAYPPDRICDFTPVADDDDPPSLDPNTIQRGIRWLMRGEQKQVIDQSRAERGEQMKIALSYFEEASRSALLQRQAKQARFQSIVLSAASQPSEAVGNARLMVERYTREIETLNRRHTVKKREFESLQIVRAGHIVHLGTAYIAPPPQVEIEEEPEVEAAAMDYVMNWERAQGWQPTDVSRRRDGSGFDIRSLGPADGKLDRPIRRIEVKGRRTRHIPVSLTVNEWNKAREDHERTTLQGTKPTYWLYVVWDALTDQPLLHRIHDPAAQLDPHEVYGLKGYQLNPSAIAGAALTDTEL